MSYDISKGIYLSRRKAKMNKKEFAKLLGISPETLTAYENGKSQPHIETIIKISNMIDCSIDEVMLLNYYITLNSTMFEDEDITFNSIRQSTKNKSRAFSKYIKECMKKTYANEINFN